MKQIVILLTISTTVFFTACKKDAGTQTGPIEIKFSADELAWVQLPLNRYFIYKDSASGTLDSVVVTQSIIERKYSPSITSGVFINPEYYYQLFSLTLSKYVGTNAQDWFYGTSGAFNTNVFGGAVSTDLAPVLMFQKDRSTNSDKSCVFASSGYIVTITTVYTAFDVLGKNYNNVKSFATSNGLDPSNPNYYKTTYYWAKGVGIIKREVKTSNSIKTDLLVRNN